MILETMTDRSGGGNNGALIETTFEEGPDGNWLHEEEAVVYGRIARLGGDALQLTGYTVDMTSYIRADQKPV